MSALRIEKTNARSNLTHVMNKVDDLRYLLSDYNRVQGNRKDVINQQVARELDDILNDLIPANDDAPVDVSAIRSQHYALTVESMEALPEDIVPLVIVRELMSRYKLRLNTAEISNWKRFFARYRGLIAG